MSALGSQRRDESLSGACREMLAKSLRIIIFAFNLFLLQRVSFIIAENLSRFFSNGLSNQPLYCFVPLQLSLTSSLSLCSHPSPPHLQVSVSVSDLRGHPQQSMLHFEALSLQPSPPLSRPGELGFVVIQPTLCAWNSSTGMFRG